MKKYYCIYKYTKGPQNTETDETDSDITAIGNTDRTNFFFLFLTGDICMGIKTQRHDKLAKPPCSAPHENYLAGVDQNFV